MKKLLIMVAIAATAVSCSKGYKISGEVEGLSGKVYLSKFEGKKVVKIDSTEAKDGKFEFKGELESPFLSTITIIDQESKSGERAITNLFLENSKINVIGKMELLDSVKVTGSKENDTYKVITKSLAGANSRESYINKIDSAVFANKGSYAATYVFYRHYVPYLEDFKQINEKIKLFETPVQNSIYLTIASELAARMEKVSVGKKFIDFTSADTLGQPIALSSVVGQGKWVLLDFWAAWCSPCRAENPHVVAAYNQYKDKGFTVFGYSLDSKDLDWRVAIVKDGLMWTNVSDLKYWESAPAYIYAVGSIPSNFLIAPDGTIAARNLRGKALSDKLNEIFPAEKK